MYCAKPLLETSKKRSRKIAPALRIIESRLNNEGGSIEKGKRKENIILTTSK